MELLTPEIREKLLANGRSPDSDQTLLSGFRHGRPGTWGRFA